MPFVSTNNRKQIAPKTKIIGNKSKKPSSKVVVKTKPKAKSSKSKKSVFTRKKK